MKTLIVYMSYHRMNTERVARAMAEAMGATLMKTDEATPEDLAAYDLVGLGSGIYGGKHHKDLLALVERMPPAEGRRVFIFSTSGGGKEENHRTLRAALTAKGCRIVGEFACKGEYRLFGPISTSKGHPDEKEIAGARTFARGLAAA